MTLSGLNVLDLSRVLAGPYCTQLLADLGATVWKIEPPAGEDTRGWGPPFVAGESGYFLSVNRGKQSFAVDLKHPRGRSLVRELALAADVLVENFKVDDLERYGLGWEQLKTDHPGLVYCSITGFGQTGPRASEPGYDAAIQALSGLMAMTGEPDGPPVKLGVAWVDVLTGLHAAVAILAALRERDRTGRGRQLDVALFDVSLATLINQAQGALLTGEPPQRRGSAHPSIVPYQSFDTADAPLMLAVGNDAQFARFCATVDRSDWVDDPRFATNAGRVEHRATLVSEIASVLRGRDREAWLTRFGAAGVPATPILDVLEALDDPQARSRGVVTAAAHAVAGEIPLLGSALRHAGADAAAAGPPPALGEHTASILLEVLGLATDDIQALAEAGVIRVPN